MTLHHTYPQSQRAMIAIIVCGNKISSPARFLLTKIQTKFKFVSRPVAAMLRRHAGAEGRPRRGVLGAGAVAATGSGGRGVGTVLLLRREREGVCKQWAVRARRGDAPAPRRSSRGQHWRGVVVPGAVAPLLRVRGGERWSGATAPAGAEPGRRRAACVGGATTSALRRLLAPSVAKLETWIVRGPDKLKPLGAHLISFPARGTNNSSVNVL